MEEVAVNCVARSPFDYAQDKLRRRVNCVALSVVEGSTVN